MRCVDYNDTRQISWYMKKKGGKVCYPYLSVIKQARKNKAYYYMCPTGNHWHLTSTNNQGALSGTIRDRVVT